MVCCTIYNHELIGFYVLDDGTVTGDRYQSMLLRYLLLKLPNYHSGMIIEQSWVPPNYELLIRQYLDPRLPESWIGSHKPILYPAKSPDWSLVTSFFRLKWRKMYVGSFQRLFSSSRQNVVKLLQPSIKEDLKWCKKPQKQTFVRNSTRWSKFWTFTKLVNIYEPHL